MQLKALAAVVSIALSLGVQAAPNSFDRGAGAKDLSKRSYSHGIDMSQASKRAMTPVAKKRGSHHHHRVGKHSIAPKAPASSTPQPQPTTYSSTPTPASSPEPTQDNNNIGSGSNSTGSGNNNSTGSGSTAPDDLAQQWLDAHNTARANHGASPLTWSNDLASAGQGWASGCKFQHSGGSLGPYGENLAAQTGSMTPAQAVQMWMSEARGYSWASGKLEYPLTAHFLTAQYDPSNPQVRCNDAFLELQNSHSSISIRTSLRLSGRDLLSSVVLSFPALLARSSQISMEPPTMVFGV